MRTRLLLVALKPLVTLRPEGLFHGGIFDMFQLSSPLYLGEARIDSDHIILLSLGRKSVIRPAIAPLSSLNNNRN